jgi:hypothetical protein
MKGSKYTASKNGVNPRHPARKYPPCNALQSMADLMLGDLSAPTSRDDLRIAPRQSAASASVPIK